jgi:hypothetical protein
MLSTLDLDKDTTVRGGAGLALNELARRGARG